MTIQELYNCLTQKLAGGTDPDLPVVILTYDETHNRIFELATDVRTSLGRLIVEGQ